MKYLKFVLVGIVFLFAWNEFNKAKVYNANDPESFDRMLYVTSPNDRQQLIDDIAVAGVGLRAPNLHGMTKEEIHVVAQEKRMAYKRQRIAFLQQLIEELNVVGQRTVKLNTNGYFLQRGQIPVEYSVEQLMAELRELSE